jgi:thioredoxin reductase
METTDVLIVGGSAAGMVTALNGKAYWPDKDFALVKMQKEVWSPAEFHTSSVHLRK